MASNLTVNVHVNDATVFTHRLLNGEYGPFAAIEVGDAALLLDLVDIQRVMQALNVAREDLAALIKAAA